MIIHEIVLFLYISLSVTLSFHECVLPNWVQPLSHPSLCVFIYVLLPFTVAQQRNDLDAWGGWGGFRQFHKLKSVSSMPRGIPLHSNSDKNSLFTRYLPINRGTFARLFESLQFCAKSNFKWSTCNERLFTHSLYSYHWIVEAFQSMHFLLVQLRHFIHIVIWKILTSEQNDLCTGLRNVWQPLREYPDLLVNSLLIGTMFQNSSNKHSLNGRDGRSEDAVRPFTSCFMMPDTSSCLYNIFPFIWTRCEYRKLDRHSSRYDTNYNAISFAKSIGKENWRGKFSLVDVVS